MENPSATSPVQSAPSYIGPFLVVTILFFIFGFLTNLNMALVDHLKPVFSLDNAWAMLVNSALFLAFFIFSTPAARMIDAIGYKRSIVVSLLILGAGCLLYVMAARLISFPLFLAAAFVVGAGIASLQTSANPYAAILGPESSAPVRLTLAQAINSIGQAGAPAFAGYFILKDIAGLTDKVTIAHTLITPYLYIAAAIFLVAIGVAILRLPRIANASGAASEGASTGRSIWSYRHTMLGVLGIFFYVGVEVSLGTVGFLYFREQGIGTEKAAAFLVSLYWTGAMIGRLLGTWMLTKIHSRKLLFVFGIAAAALVVVSMMTHGTVAIWAVVLCGFFNSIMFPNIFALGIAGLGPLTSKGSGLIISACVGGAVIPWLVGAAADRIGGYQHALFIPVLCYLYIAYYGLWGSKPA